MEIRGREEDTFCPRITKCKTISSAKLGILWKTVGGALSGWSIVKMSVKMNLRIKTKNHIADPEKEILTKSISKPYGGATAMPPAGELIISLFLNEVLNIKNKSSFESTIDKCNYRNFEFLFLIRLIWGPLTSVRKCLDAPPSFTTNEF